MTACRVCGTDIAATSYTGSAPALTSMTSFIDGPTQVYVCTGCGHSQSADFPDIDSYYDTTYRVSLESDDHDQIFAVDANGQPIFRTDHQAAVGLSLLDLPEGALILDYGSAKADTLRKMHRARPDLRPHVFDVSNDYKSSWKTWVAEDDQSTYEVPAAWAGRFQAIISHFVIEHVATPVEFLKVLRDLLAPGGRLLLSMPDVAANPGDMIVADHLNHFSTASLKKSFALAGFSLEIIDSTAFPGAFFAVAARSEEPVSDEIDRLEIVRSVEKAKEICLFWEEATVRLDSAAKQFSGRRAAIYGASFYGSWINSRVAESVDLAVFLDQNPKLQGSLHFDRPVVSVSSLPNDVDVIFVGLNPLKARTIIGAQPELNRPDLALVWISE